MCKEIDKFADELSSEERTKAAAVLLKMGCKGYYQNADAYLWRL